MTTPDQPQSETAVSDTETAPQAQSDQTPARAGAKRTSGQALSLGLAALALLISTVLAWQFWQTKTDASPLAQLQSQAATQANQLQQLRQQLEQLQAEDAANELIKLQTKIAQLQQQLSSQQLELAQMAPLESLTRLQQQLSGSLEAQQAQHQRLEELQQQWQSGLNFEQLVADQQQVQQRQYRRLGLMYAQLAEQAMGQQRWREAEQHYQSLVQLLTAFEDQIPELLAQLKQQQSQLEAVAPLAQADQLAKLQQQIIDSQWPDAYRLDHSMPQDWHWQAWRQWASRLVQLERPHDQVAWAWRVSPPLARRQLLDHLSQAQHFSRLGLTAEAQQALTQAEQLLESALTQDQAETVRQQFNDLLEPDSARPRFEPSLLLHLWELN